MSNSTNFQKVIQFHKCAEHPSYTTPQNNIFDNRPDRVKLRMDLIREEFKELETAIQEKNFTEVNDALTDLLYVIYGTGAEFGINLDKSFEIVHESNMTKFCNSEKEAEYTVEWYKQQYKEGKVPYKSPAYRQSPDNIHWVVYDQDNDKALKSIYYVPAKLD